jgi:hypothetical protein
MKQESPSAHLQNQELCATCRKAEVSEVGKGRILPLHQFAFKSPAFAGNTERLPTEARPV